MSLFFLGSRKTKISISITHVLVVFFSFFDTLIWFSVDMTDTPPTRPSQADLGRSRTLSMKAKSRYCRESAQTVPDVVVLRT